MNLLASAFSRKEGLKRILGVSPLRGAVAGAFATAPMTLSIYLVDRLVPHAEQGELPPRQITEGVADLTGTDDHAGEIALDLATEGAHFAFGAAAGAAYGLIAERIPLRPPVAGIGFALAVWAAAYAGALPELGLQPPPDRRPAWRNLTMIAGHVVWGAALAGTERRLRPDRWGTVTSERQRRERGPAEVHW